MDSNQIIQTALSEDIGPGDITTNSVVPSDAVITAELWGKEDGILCGKDMFIRTFLAVSADITFDFTASDGTRFKKNTRLAVFKGPASAILMAERTALNFIQMLSGIATKVSKYTRVLKDHNSNIKILDTRKTVPLYRKLSKYAVRVGGGTNHRFGLFDAVLIKENHLLFHPTLRDAVQAAKTHNRMHKVEVEVKSIEEVKEVLPAEPDIIMLDNFKINDIPVAAKIIKSFNRNILIELSGNVTAENIAEYADFNIDFISIGDLTKNISVIDFSLLLKS